MRKIISANVDKNNIDEVHEYIIDFFHDKVIKLSAFNFVPWLIEKNDFKNKVLTMVDKFPNVSTMYPDESGYYEQVVKIKFPEGEARLREKPIK